MNGLPAAQVSIDDLFKASVKEGERLELAIAPGRCPVNRNLETPPPDLIT